MIKLLSILKESIGTNEFNNSLGEKFKKLLPYVKVTNSGVMASTHQGKSEPTTRIDSKLKPTSIWIMTKSEGNNFHVIIKTIVNNKENNLPGYGQKLLQSLIDTVKEYQDKNKDINYIVDIDHDVSGGFWSHYTKKHPEIHWEYTN